MSGRPAVDSSKSRAPKRFDATAREREERITRLFRRWPALTKREASELKRLWTERVRLARHSR